MSGGTQLRSCLVPVVDDAGLHQIGDPVADRPRMDAETLLAAERVGHRLGKRAEAKLDRRVVGDQAGDGEQQEQPMTTTSIPNYHRARRRGRNYTCPRVRGRTIQAARNLSRGVLRDH